ncbi:MAG: hypothetical protein ACREEN_01525 [Stellaceae bacterium]
MIQMNVILNGDNCWPDLKDKKIIHLANDAPPMQVALLDGGLQSGRPSVALRVDLPDGQVLVAETTARLFCAAARAIMAKYPTFSPWISANGNADPANHD